MKIKRNEVQIYTDLYSMPQAVVESIKQMFAERKGLDISKVVVKPVYTNIWELDKIENIQFFVTHSIQEPKILELLETESLRQCILFNVVEHGETNSGLYDIYNAEYSFGNNTVHRLEDLYASEYNKKMYILKDDNEDDELYRIKQEAKDDFNITIQYADEKDISANRFLGEVLIFVSVENKHAMYKFYKDASVFVRDQYGTFIKIVEMEKYIMHTQGMYNRCGSIKVIK